MATFLRKICAVNMVSKDVLTCFQDYSFIDRSRLTTATAVTYITSS